MLPTLSEFLERNLPRNSYIEHPEFASLYIRKSRIAVMVNGVRYYCNDVITIANIESAVPGRGAFQRLTEEIVGLDKAIYVECVHNERFRKTLVERGFMRVNDNQGYHYLFNYEGRLELPRLQEKVRE